MPVKRAHILSDADVMRVLRHIAINSRQPQRDTALVQLTVSAGLRIGEACNVYLQDITYASGTFRENLFVSSRGAKNGKSREVPMRPELIEALERYLEWLRSQGRYPRDHGRIFYSLWGTPLESSTARTQLWSIYKAAGLHWCSSHSGRRTFGTRAARAVGKVGGSILDVRDLLGHRDIKTTMDYVDPSDSLRNLVLSL